MEPFLYNKGAGRYVPKTAIVLNRNRERPRHKQFPEIRNLENPDVDFDIEQYMPEVTEEDYLLNSDLYRPVCWDLKVSL